MTPRAAGVQRISRRRPLAAVAAVTVAGAALAACGGSGPVVSGTTVAPTTVPPASATTSPLNSATTTPPTSAPATTTPATSGEASKSGRAILADAKRATDAASSLTVSGTVDDSGKAITLDLALGHGSGGGDIGEDGESFQIIVRPPNLYLKASTATWTKLSNASIAALLANKWIQTSSSDASFSSLSELLNASKLTGQLTPHGAVVKGAVATFAGQPAIPLTDPSDGKGGTLYVAATGSPYILGLTGGSGASHGTLTFSKYGTTTLPAAPAGALSLSKLEQGG